MIRLSSVVAGYVWDHTPRGLRAAICATEGWEPSIAGLSYAQLSRPQRAAVVERQRRALDTYAIQYGDGLAV